MEKLWTKDYIKVLTANFTLFFAFYLLTPLLPLYLVERWGATKDVVGIVLSGYTVVALVVRLFAGHIVDSYPRKKVLLICFALFALFFGGYIAASSLLLFTIVRTLHGGPFGALTVANTTACVDVLPPSRKAEGTGYYGLGNNLGMALAPSIGLWIYQSTRNFELLFWLALGMAAVGLLIDATLHLPRQQVMPVPAKEYSRRRYNVLNRYLLLRGWVLSVNIAFFGFCFGVLQNYLAIYMKEEHGIVGVTGTFFMLVSTGLIVSRLQGARALREGKLTQNCLEGAIIASLGYILFITVPQEWAFYVSALLIGFGQGHLWPAFLNMMLGIARPDQSGIANSTLLVAWDVGLGIGVLLGGAVSEYFSYTVTFVIVALTEVAGTLLFAFVGQKNFRKLQRGQK